MVLDAVEKDAPESIDFIGKQLKHKKVKVDKCLCGPHQTEHSGFIGDKIHKM